VTVWEDRHSGREAVDTGFRGDNYFGFIEFLAVFGPDDLAH
jgi:hypothetical protein